MALAPSSQPLKVANAGTTSAAFDLRGTKIVGIGVPAIDSGTVRLQVSYDGGTTFLDVKDVNLGVLQFIAGVGAFAMDGDYIARVLLGASHFRIVTGATQTADRIFTVLTARE